MFDMVVFSEIVPFIILSWCQKNTDVFTSLFVMEPLMAHIPGFGALELYIVMDIAKHVNSILGGEPASHALSQFTK